MVTSVQSHSLARVRARLEQLEKLFYYGFYSVALYNLINPLQKSDLLPVLSRLIAWAKEAKDKT